MIEGQRNLRDAVRRTISYEAPGGRRYQLEEKTATLCVRPRVRSTQIAQGFCLPM